MTAFLLFLVINNVFVLLKKHEQAFLSLPSEFVNVYFSVCFMFFGLIAIIVCLDFGRIGCSTFIVFYVSFNLYLIC